MRKNLGLAIFAMGLASVASAQEDAATTIKFGVVSQVRADDNWALEAVSPGRSFQFSNALSVDVKSETRLSRIDLSAGANVHTTRIAGSANQAGLADPFASATFSREVADTVLQLDASARVTDRDIGLSTSVGTRKELALGGSFTFGLGQPFGGSIGVSTSKSDYSDGDDTSTKGANVSVKLETSPKLTVSPSASFTEHTVDEGSDSTTKTLSAGASVSARISEVLTLDGSVQRVTIDSTDAGESRAVTTELSLIRQSATGKHSLGISTGVSHEGPRAEIHYRRVFEIGDSDASYGIGVARGADDSVSVTGQFSIKQDLRNGQITGNFDRRYQTANDGHENFKTNLSGSLRHDLSELSAITLSVDFAQSNEISDAVNTDASLSASLDRRISDDWDLSAGVEHRYTRDGDTDPARSNALFLRVSRSWTATR